MISNDIFFITHQKKIKSSKKIQDLQNKSSISNAERITH